MNDVRRPYETNLPESKTVGIIETNEWMITLPPITLDDLENAKLDSVWIRTSTMMRISEDFSKKYLDKIKCDVKEMVTSLNPEYAKYFQPFVGIDCHVGNTNKSSGCFILINVKILKRVWTTLRRKKPFPIHHWLFEENGHLIRFDTSPTGLVSTQIDKKPYRHYSSAFLQEIITKSTVLSKLNAHVCHLGRELSEKTVCILAKA